MDLSYIVVQIVIIILIVVAFSLAILGLFRRRSKCSLDYLEGTKGVTLRHALELCVLEKTPPIFRGVAKLLVNMLCVEDLVKLCKE